MPKSSLSVCVFWARCVFAAVLASSASVPTVGFGQSSKLKQPEQAGISREVTVVTSTFEREIQEAAKDEAAATKLVDELLSKVPATPDPEGKWALLQVAQGIAVEESGNIDAAMKCVTARARTFDVDVVKERLEVLKEFSKPKPPANATLYGKAVQAAREALEMEKYSEAREAADIASDVAKALLKDEKEEARRILKQNKRKVKPPAPEAEATYVLPAAQLGRRIVEAESLSNANAAALPVLMATPNDKAAQGSVGEYKCFLKSAWAEGLSLIANSRNPKVAEIASTELRARDPVDTATLLDAADRWWDFAKNDLKESEVKREAVQRHAVDIYALVLPNLKRPLDEKRAKDRMAELGRSSGSTTDPRDGRQGQLNGYVVGTWRGLRNGYIARFNSDGSMSIDEICGGTWCISDDGRLIVSRSNGPANESINIAGPTRLAWPDGGESYKLSPDSTFDVAKSDLAANKEAAGWALALKGKVEIEHPDQRREWLDSPSKVPAGPFVVTAIDLVANQGVNDNETARLSKLFSLEGLGLGGTAITDVTMEQIGHLPKLKGLGINWTKVTGKGIEKLAACKLDSIDCSGVQDIHRGIQRLQAMGTLRVLVFGLTDMQKNPDTLKLVSEMKTLRHLQFGKDDMSATQIQSLQQSLPECAFVK